MPSQAVIREARGKFRFWRDVTPREVADCIAEIERLFDAGLRARSLDNLKGVAAQLRWLRLAVESEGTRA